MFVRHVGSDSKRIHEHTWLCAISHIFHITGSHVKLVSDFAGKIPFSDMLQDRRQESLANANVKRATAVHV